MAIAKFLRTPVLINTCEHILSMFQDNIQKMKLSLIHFNRKYKESVEKYGSIIIYLKTFQISLLMQLEIKEYYVNPAKHEKRIQKQPFIGLFSKKCSEYMQLIYRRTPTLKLDFNKFTFQLYTKLETFSMKVIYTT